jgi:hypothetical protein
VLLSAVVRPRAWWICAAAVGPLIAYLLARVAFDVHFHPELPPWRLVAARAAFVILGVPFAQAVVRVMRDGLSKLFKVDVPAYALPQDRWPSEIVGTLENVLFPWLLLGVGYPGATAMGAWIVLKTLANWRGWKTDHEDPATDPNRGRRVLYVFIVCNAWQVFYAVALAWILAGIA